MDSAFKTKLASNNIIKLLQNRERKLEDGKLVQKHLQFTETLLKRLGLESELDGHQGCVNCLQWSSDGRRLASGSDDTNVIIWDPFRCRLLKTIQTSHYGNIFSVKFLGSNDSLVATCAGDFKVLVQSIEPSSGSQTPHLDCNCHKGRVKRLATAPEEPLLFWSASEDGLAIQYDLREPHECNKKNKVFIDLSSTSYLKCIAVNPVRPHLVAIGANDVFVRLYDRRMMKVMETGDPRCVQYYAPGHLVREMGEESKYKFATTYITFDSTGSDMLVNMGGEQIYIFNINHPRPINELLVPGSLLQKNSTLYKPCCFVKGNGTTNSCRKLISYNRRIANQPCACDYLGRAQTFCNRKWTGDIYGAARDYLHIIQHWPDNTEAYINFIRCLITLNWPDEANVWMDYFHKNKPEFADNPLVDGLRTELEALENSKKLTNNEKSTERPCSDVEKQLRQNSRDYEMRYLGHCNTTTDIKEANFLGKDNEFICAGSDDGIIFIWNRYTTNVVAGLWGDVSIVNCVQPHPTHCFIASSGIDMAVKLWSPKPEEGEVNKLMVVDPWAAVEANQQRMAMDPFETILANMGYRISPIDNPQISSCRTS